MKSFLGFLFSLSWPFFRRVRLPVSCTSQYSTTMTIREVNWCSQYGDRHDCFPWDEPVFVFDNEVCNLPALLVMSGMYPTYLDALRAGHKGFIDPGWSYVEANGVVAYFWNPDPEWDETSDSDEIVQEKDFFHEAEATGLVPPWFEDAQAWEEELKATGVY